MTRGLLVLGIVLAVAACSGSNLYCKGGECWRAALDEGRVSQRLLLVGDAGKIVKKGTRRIKKKALVNLIKSYSGIMPEKTTLVFLGDNIYKYGLPNLDDLPLEKDKKCAGRACAESRLDVQIDLAREHHVRGIFIPGNHDWNNDRENGWERIRNMGDYLAKVRSDENVNVSFLPGNGCPGPKRVLLGEGQGAVTLLVFDTEWWIYDHKKPGAGNPSGCQSTTKKQVLQALRAQIEMAGKDHHPVMVIGHHTLESLGRHSGYFSFRDLGHPGFILSQIKNSTPWATRQYIANPVYREMRESIETIFMNAAQSGLGPIFYVSGHDHSLQVIEKPGGNSSVFYLVSGLGSGSDQPVGHDSSTQFSLSSERGGFLIADFMEDGRARVAALVPMEDGKECTTPVRKNACEVFSMWMVPGAKQIEPGREE